MPGQGRAYASIESEPCSHSPLENSRITEGANGYSTLSNSLSGKLLTADASSVSAEPPNPDSTQTRLWQL